MIATASLILFGREEGLCGEAKQMANHAEESLSRSVTAYLRVVGPAVWATVDALYWQVHV